MTSESKFFEQYDQLVEERYRPLADHARKTGQTMTADYLVHLVRVEIRSELLELSSHTQSAPHPGHTSEPDLLAEEETSHA